MINEKNSSNRAVFFVAHINNGHLQLWWFGVIGGIWISFHSAFLYESAAALSACREPAETILSMLSFRDAIEPSGKEEGPMFIYLF